MKAPTFAEASDELAVEMHRVAARGGPWVLAYLDELLTVDDVARWCLVDPGTVYRWATDGSGPARVKVGTAVRFRRRDVLRWLEERTVEPERVARRYTRDSRHRPAAAETSEVPS